MEVFMEKLVFDSGVREFEINGAGVLRFNPGDPNVYARLVEAGEKIRAVEQELAQGTQTDGAAVLKLLAEADRRIKEILGWVFGEENDFEKLFGGVNLLAVAGNGERVIGNFIAALQPVLEEGAQRCVRQVEDAVALAEQERSRRGLA